MKRFLAPVAAGLLSASTPDMAQAEEPAPVSHDEITQLIDQARANSQICESDCGDYGVDDPLVLEDFGLLDDMDSSDRAKLKACLEVNAQNHETDTDDVTRVEEVRAFKARIKELEKFFKERRADGIMTYAEFTKASREISALKNRLVQQHNGYNGCQKRNTLADESVLRELNGELDDLKSRFTSVTSREVERLLDDAVINGQVCEMDCNGDSDDNEDGFRFEPLEYERVEALMESDLNEAKACLTVNAQNHKKDGDGVTRIEEFRTVPERIDRLQQRAETLNARYPEFFEEAATEAEAAIQKLRSGLVEQSRGTGDGENGCPILDTLKNQEKLNELMTEMDASLTPLERRFGIGGPLEIRKPIYPLPLSDGYDPVEFENDKRRRAELADRRGRNIPRQSYALVDDTLGEYNEAALIVADFFGDRFGNIISPCVYREDEHGMDYEAFHASPGNNPSQVLVQVSWGNPSVGQPRITVLPPVAQTEVDKCFSRGVIAMAGELGQQEGLQTAFATSLENVSVYVKMNFPSGYMSVHPPAQ